MTPAQLSRTVVHVVRSAVEAGELSVPDEALAPLVAEAGGADGGARRGIVRVPPRPGCGDFASHVALRLAAASGQAPRDVAEVLRRRLAEQPGIERVEVAGPGFVNITVAAGAHAGLVREVLAQGAAYGQGEGLVGTRLRLRYQDGARGALFAEVIARLVTACGGEVDVLPSGGGAASLAATPTPTPTTSGAGPSIETVLLSVREPGRTLDQLVESLGRDGARWALLSAAVHDVPRCDPSEVLAQRESNPLFRVRYAHARVRALLRNGRDLGIEPDADGPFDTDTDTDNVADAVTDTVDDSAARARGALLALLADYPRVVEAAARRHAPDRLARELTAVADAFFRFHDGCAPLPRGEEKPSAAHRVRLATAEAAGTVLANGLNLLGISAPAHL
ncbi:DALR anticodon-binding domain-containing protein [Streptomyces sp. 71268]|uniref:ArgS-related anticodon-binding protein NrtL n=1 Tax=Streptomyces sp. 71268 TaxID=3002640 RepID=UPI0023F6D7AE|nr:DALR anticodon-binding domain-containing protein [Streptomyces sp. 71268]WEV25324.1 DALR anticodon-binding domain-containing protein [Streptomyces sp. 71268]